nr:hypothetical protein [Tanacetum cinerariifolium]
DKIIQALEITKLKQRVKKLERRNKTSKLKRLKKGRIIADMDADNDVTLKDVAAVTKDDQDVEMEESADVQGRQAKSQAKIYQIDLEHADKKEDNAMKRYQALKRKPQTKAQARKNMMIYLRNVVGFKMDYFKGMTYDDIRLIFEKKFNSNVAFLLKTKEQMDEEDSRALKRLSESQEDKAAKKQKLDEEVEELKRHLQIVPNDEDDVYTEATPLARKVPVVDYEIYTENNKPYYKIKRADSSHQLYLSFLSMLRNFDREDMEPDIQAQILKNQRSAHSQAKSWWNWENISLEVLISSLRSKGKYVLVVASSGMSTIYKSSDEAIPIGNDEDTMTQNCISGLKPRARNKVLEAKVYRKWISRKSSNPAPKHYSFILLDKESVRFNCDGTVIGVNTTRDWYYESGCSCAAKVIDDTDFPSVPIHGLQLNRAYRYNFKACISDGTTTGEFTFFTPNADVLTSTDCTKNNGHVLTPDVPLGTPSALNYFTCAYTGCPHLDTLSIELLYMCLHRMPPPGHPQH